MKQELILQQEFQEESTSIVMGLIFSPWVSLALFLCVIAILFGIYFRLHKLVASSGLIALCIAVFRMFSSQLFGSYSLFQAKIIIPLFILTMCAKLVSDFMSKKSKEAEDAEYKGSSTRRKSITASSTRKTLTRFGDEKKFSINPNEERFESSKTSMPVKLNRNF